VGKPLQTLIDITKERKMWEDPFNSILFSRTKKFTDEVNNFTGGPMVEQPKIRLVSTVGRPNPESNNIREFLSKRQLYALFYTTVK
jgi:hypothetical protein